MPVPRVQARLQRIVSQGHTDSAGRSFEPVLTIFTNIYLIKLIFYASYSPRFGQRGTPSGTLLTIKGGRMRRRQLEARCRDFLSPGAIGGEFLSLVAQNSKISHNRPIHPVTADTPGPRPRPHSPVPNRAPAHRLASRRWSARVGRPASPLCWSYPKIRWLHSHQSRSVRFRRQWHPG